MGNVVPFPRVRDRRFVERHAGWLASLKPAVAEKHLAQQLKVQRTTMERRGIEPALIEEQLRMLETAIRFEMTQYAIGDRA